MRLGINIDHVATLRNARGGGHPAPLRAAEVVKAAGADILTIHLREDRRHIRDMDAAELIASQLLPVNFEMAATDEMLEFALKHKPHAACIVPEKREELTTEGGMNVAGNQAQLTEICTELKAAGIRTSLFIDPDEVQIRAAKAVGADCIELHTGTYAEHFPHSKTELEKLATSAKFANSLGIEVHAGHGLTYENVADVAAIQEIKELNIGHFLIGEAIFIGLEQAIKKMHQIIREHSA